MLKCHADPLVKFPFQSNMNFAAIVNGDYYLHLIVDYDL
jgi:hypothetical protein